MKRLLGLLLLAAGAVWAQPVTTGPAVRRQCSATVITNCTPLVNAAGTLVPPVAGGGSDPNAVTQSGSVTVNHLAVIAADKQIKDGGAVPAAYTLPTATDAIKGGVTMSTATSAVATSTDDARLSDARTPVYVATNPQTGTTYALLTGDRSKLVTLTNGASIAVSIAAAGSTGFADGWETTVLNSGVGAATITPTTSTIEGVATLVLTTGQAARIWSNGTNYRAARLGKVAAATVADSTTGNAGGTAAGLAAQYVDWNAASGGASIANKPSLGTASAATIGTGAGQVPVTGNYQPSDADLTGLAGLTLTRGGLIYGSGATPAWTMLAAGTQGYLFIMGANEPAWAAVPTWNQSTSGTAAGLTAQYVDWSAGSGGASIANKPSLGTASAATLGTGAGQVPVAGEYQPSDADLAAIAALTCSENQIIKLNGSAAWVCAADATAGAPTFDGIGSGTNTSGAMVVSTGASLSASGTGTIVATSASGNAGTATALAADPADCTNQFARGVAASGAAACASVAGADIAAATITPAKMAASTFDAQTDSASVTWAIGSVLNAQSTLTLINTTATRALNITNPVVGGNYLIILTQDATGGALLTLGTGCTWKVAGGGGGLVALTAAANSIDILTFTYDGTNCYATLLPNFN